jgi:hypothetical protein
VTPYLIPWQEFEDRKLLDTEELCFEFHLAYAEARRLKLESDNMPSDRRTFVRCALAIAHADALLDRIRVDLEQTARKIDSDTN